MVYKLYAFSQVGRAAAGYTNYREGGVGPVAHRIIPLVERASFRMFAATLLEGPPIAPPLRLSLALVLLLHHPAVKAEYPNHRLVLEMNHARVKCAISEVQFNNWITSTEKYNSDANKRGLTLSQVYNLYM